MGFWPSFTTPLTAAAAGGVGGVPVGGLDVVEVEQPVIVQTSATTNAGARRIKVHSSTGAMNGPRVIEDHTAGRRFTSSSVRFQKCLRLLSLEIPEPDATKSQIDQK
jgi:hypothetical protein